MSTQAPGALPGSVVIPQSYGKQMVLYSAVDDVDAVVDGAPPGTNGRHFTVPEGKATIVPYEAGRFLLEHLAYTGIVRVEERQTETGVQWDIEDAKQRSLAATEQADQMVFNRWLNGVVDDYVKRNKPVPQPDPRMLKIIKRRGYNLQQFGITPIGWEKPEDARVKSLSDENADLKRRIEMLEALATK